MQKFVSNDAEAAKAAKEDNVHERQGSELWQALNRLHAALQQSSADDGAMEADDLAYKERMDHAEEIRIKFEQKLRDDGIEGCMIQHDIHDEGPIGISIEQEKTNPKDYAEITKVTSKAAAHGNMTAKVFVNMYFCAIGDFDCDDKDIKEIVQAIKDAPRPVTITCALPDLTHKIDLDGDGSGEQLEIQSVVNAMQSQIREQSVELKHLRHEMTQRDEALDEHVQEVEQIVHSSSEVEMQRLFKEKAWDDAEGAELFRKMKHLHEALQVSSADEGAMEAEDIEYRNRMVNAERIRAKFESKLREEGIAGCMVQHDIFEEGSTGIDVDKSADFAEIVALDAGGRHGCITDKLHVGMRLCAIGDMVCDGLSCSEIAEAVETAHIPYTVTCAMTDLTQKLDKDHDGSKEELQIQSVVNALQTELREQLVEIRHLRHEMGQRDAALDAHVDDIAKEPPPQPARD